MVRTMLSAATTAHFLCLAVRASTLAIGLLARITQFLGELPTQALENHAQFSELTETRV